MRHFDTAVVVVGANPIRSSAVRCHDDSGLESESRDQWSSAPYGFWKSGEKAWPGEWDSDNEAHLLARSR